ncbi:MAG: hypothetical protein ACYS1A_16465 [Planctomycetota bacterium]|jgi:hypothetical protein
MMQTTKNADVDKICYLCGHEITGKVSKEHVPPKQFYAKALRQARSLNLLTLPSHEDCNKSYQDDEDYFFAALAGLNEDAKIHEWLMGDVRKKIWRNDADGLRQKVLSEFSETVSGIYLPKNLVAKKFDVKRANRVVWKIVRGLCYHHYSRVLPANIKHGIKFLQMQDEPPKMYREHLMDKPVFGVCPEVFVYRFAKVNDKNSLSALWALFFWQSIVAIVAVTASEIQDDEAILDSS